MIDVKRIRENPEELERLVRKKGAEISVSEILRVDDERRRLTSERDALRAEQNAASAEFPGLEGSGRDKTLEQLKILKSKIADLEFALHCVEEELEAALYAIPNPPLESVPDGKDERDNRVLYETGERHEWNFEPKDYLTLAEELDIIDVKRAGKVSGSRFGYLKGDAALLEFALIQLGVKVLTSKETVAEIIDEKNLALAPVSFIPIVPPVFVRPEMLGKMGYLRRNSKFPKWASPSYTVGRTRSGFSQIPNSKTETQKETDKWVNEEVYFLRDDDLALVGTSEQSIGPMHAEEIFEEKDLPRRYLGLSTCFRREAGSYGKDTKGILRVHQFDKLEMLSYARAQDSVLEHQLMLACEEYLMRQLELPYRVLNICAGDLGAPAAAKYDIEAWLPGQAAGKGEYRETHSTSNTTDFQARRLNIRYRDANDELKFAHMLNGTALAIGRMIIAIIENYQTKEGRIRVPKALQSYIGKEIIG